MEKIWLKHYPPGIPAEVDVDRYESLAALIEEFMQKYADRPAFENLGLTLSYRELDRLSLRFAAYLQDRLGLKKGDKFAIMMPNLLQYPVVLFGALRAGLIIVNVNPLYTPRELKYQLKDSGAKAIVILENFASVLAEVIAETPIETTIMTRVGDQLKHPKAGIVNFAVKHIKKMVPKYHFNRPILWYRDVLRAAKNCSFKRPDISREDLAFLQYTGGTTGLSKGAMISNRNICGNMIQALTWLTPVIDPKVQQVIVTPLPLYHMFALMANCLVFSTLGGLNVLVTNPRDIPGLVKTLKKSRFTALTGVNTLFNALLHNPEFQKLDFSQLQVALGGGMACQKAVADRWKQLTGKPLMEAYGLTEASPGLTMNPFDQQEFTGFVGMPLPSTLVSIRGEEGEELPLGTPGELWAHGPQVMKGYWNKPEETEKVLTKDGWLRTGDIAIMDERGYLKLVDRKKDMIIVSGFNVYPNEIEDIVVTHPGIVEAAAIGVASEKSGEIVKVYAVKKDPHLTEDELIKYCRQFLTGYKVPKIIEFRKELPKTNVGKILRRELREPSGAMS